MRMLLLHPFFFAIYRILFLYTHNIEEASFKDIFRPLGISLMATFLLLIIVKRWVRKKYYPEIILSVFVILFFNFHTIMSAIDVLRIDFLLSAVNFLHASIFLFFLLSVIAFIGVRKIPEKFYPQCTKILGVSSLCLLLWQPPQIISHHLGMRKWKSSQSVQTKNTYDGKKRPDIYFITLDSYARWDILQDIYNYDNSDFIKYLIGKGFYVAGKSHSNYLWTVLSLSSQLNLSYIDDIPGIPKNRSQAIASLFFSIKHSFVRDELERWGYKYIGNTQQEKYVFEINQNYEAIKFKKYITDFENLVLDSTPINAIIRQYLPVDSGKRHREEILFRLNAIPSVINDPSPTFLHTHVICPHHPFVFGKGGKNIYKTYASLTRRKKRKRAKLYRKYYLYQLKHITPIIKNVIDEVLAKSQEKPIIILQSDHGPGSSRKLKDKSAASYVRERFSNLLAIYYPDQDYRALYADMSLVNTFRAVFNHYFDSNYKMLPDKTYYSPSNNLYKTVDCTELYKNQ